MSRPAATGTYEIIRLLPTDGDDCQYRIKNSAESFERVARESAAERETTNLSSKLEHHFGPSIYTDFITEKRVLDFGSGTGKEAVTCAAHSAAIVVGSVSCR